MADPGVALANLYQGRSLEQIRRYVDILATTGLDRGLIGPRERDRLWDRHIANSAALTDLVPCGSSLVDVGSGAGLPGLPLAVLRADLQVTLLEPLLRRSAFLTEAVDQLEVGDRVTVVRERAEDHRRRYDVVTARAVAPLERLVTWCAPLLAPGGQLLALKGRTAADEVAAAGPALAARRLAAEVLTARATPEVEPATVVRVRALP